MAICALAAAGAARAQDELPDEVREKILEKLEKLTESAVESKFGKFSSAATAFQAAAASPATAYEFYVDCYKLVYFDREGKSFSEFREWKAENAQKLRATEYANALQMQLQYLALTIRYINMEDQSQIVAPLSAYIDSLVANEKRIGRQRRVLQEDISLSVFAQAYRLQNAIIDQKSWETVPINLHGHFQRVILPILRESGTTDSIAAAWDRYIQLEAALVANREDVGMEEEFKERRLPSLQWAKWSDVADHGGRPKAAAAMLALLEKNIHHDEAENWILDLTDVANGVRLSDQ